MPNPARRKCCLHKVSISHDETKISYTKQMLENLPKSEYMGAVICYADFDAAIPATRNEVEYRYPNFVGALSKVRLFSGATPPVDIPCPETTAHLTSLARLRTL